MRSQSLIALSLVWCLGCGALGPPPEGQQDGSPTPTVASTTPADGARGVGATDVIRIRFDRPMDPVTTQQALQTASLTRPVIRWEERDTTMVVTPGEPMDYAAGDGLDFPARRYELFVTTVARDARGVPMAAPFALSFTTLRRSKVVLGSDPDLDGYVRQDGDTTVCQEQTRDISGLSFAACVGHSMSGNQPYHGLLTFDLSPIPRDLVGVAAAKLSVFQYLVNNKPYMYLGSVMLEQIAYDRPDMAFTQAARKMLGVLSDNAELTWKTVSGPVLAELVAGEARSTGRVQFRMVFSNPHSPYASSGHVAKFYTSRVRLAAEDPANPDRRARAPRLELELLLP